MPVTAIGDMRLDRERIEDIGFIFLRSGRREISSIKFFWKTVVEERECVYELQNKETDYT